MTETEGALKRWEERRKDKGKRAGNEGEERDEK